MGGSYLVLTLPDDTLPPADDGDLQRVGIRVRGHRVDPGHLDHEVAHGIHCTDRVHAAVY
jgi:hypothetical protein